MRKEIKKLLNNVRDLAQKLSKSTEYLDYYSFSQELVHEMIKNELFAINIPTEYGGLGLSLPDICEIFIELSHGDLSASAILGSHIRVAFYIREFGTEQQKDTYLKKMVNGEIIFSHAHTEKDQPVISSQSNFGFSINGKKTSVTNAKKGTHVAITSDGGQNIFLVDKTNTGVDIGDNILRNGIQCTSLCPITFNNCLISMDSLLGGKQGNASKYIMSSIGYTLVNYAARSIGLGRSIYDMLITAINNGDLHEDKQLHSLICTIDGQLIAAELLTHQAAVEVEEDPENTRNAYHARWFGAEICHSAAIQAFDYLAREPGNIHIIERIIADASYLKIIGKRLPELKPLVGKSLIHNSSKSNK